MREAGHGVQVSPGGPDRRNQSAQNVQWREHMFMHRGLETEADRSRSYKSKHKSNTVGGLFNSGDT